MCVSHSPEEVTFQSICLEGREGNRRGEGEGEWVSVAMATTSCHSVKKLGTAEIDCLQGSGGLVVGGDSPKMGLIIWTSTHTHTHTVKQMLVASFMSMNKLPRGLLHFLQE